MAGFVLYVGGRLPTVTQLTSGVSESNDGAKINMTYSQAGLLMAGGTRAAGIFFDPAAAPLLTPYTAPAGHSYYYHFYVGTNPPSYPNSLGDVLTLVDAAGDPWIKMNIDATPNMFFFYNSGTGGSPIWTALNTTGIAVPSGGTFTLDIEIAFAASGPHAITVSINGVALYGPANFTQALLGLGGFHLTGTSNGSIVFSEILCTEDVSTIGAHVFTSRPTGAGAHSDWTGTYADVDAALTQTVNVNQATSAGLLQSYPMSNITVPSGYAIGSVFQWLYAKNAGSAPDNIDAIVRPISTDYVSSNLNGISSSFSGIGSRYDVNPDTSVAWTQSDWNVPAQMGYESAI